MAKRFNYQKGKLGEQIAREFLVGKGYEAIKSNFQTRFGEIDLICAKADKLVFVEVKLRVGKDFGRPEEMINPGKIRQVEKTGQIFLQKNPEFFKKYESFRIDAVCIELAYDGSVLQINHYSNISGEI